MRHDEEETEAHDPLIAGEDEDGDVQHGQSAIDTHEPVQVTLRTAGKVIWLLTFSAGISGLLFGYDTGVISSTLISIGSDLSHRPLTTTDKSLITAITSLFALLFAPTTGYLADKYGRRFVILLANLLFIAGALVQAVAGYVWLMVLGRAAVGAAVGMASCATPLYITELAPAALRGRLVTIQSLFITGGQVVAYFIGWMFSRWHAGWRWMVGLGAVPAIVQLFLLALMFETPRWLVKTGKNERARAVLQKIYGGLNERERRLAVEIVLADILAEASDDTKLTSDHTLQTTAKQLVDAPGNRRALTIACMLQGLQQLCGFNSLMYFSATIFQLVGFNYPIGTSLTIAGTNFIFTLCAFAFIDILGRRKILLYSIPFMILGLGFCSLSFQYIDIFRGHAGTKHELEGSPRWDTVWTSSTTTAAHWPAVLITSMIVYVASYAIGLGCVPWQQSELFPLRVRSLGSGIATATNWSTNFVIGITFLPMMEGLGASVTFVVYALVCIIGWFGVYRIYPETAGLELEGVGELLKDGWGVKESVERFNSSKRVVPGTMSRTNNDR